MTKSWRVWVRRVIAFIKTRIFRGEFRKIHHAINSKIASKRRRRCHYGTASRKGTSSKFDVSKILRGPAGVPRSNL